MAFWDRPQGCLENLSFNSKSRDKLWQINIGAKESWDRMF